MGQDRSPLPFFTASIVVGPAPSTGLFRHSAPVYPPPPCPAGRPGSLSDRRCHKPSYISPRVTKLRDAGDKAGSAGGRSRRITSLAVCLSLIFAAVWKSDCQPLQSREGCYSLVVFFSSSIIYYFRSCFSSTAHASLRSVA